jgi:predicted HTH transcriptional regulator
MRIESSSLELNTLEDIELLSESEELECKLAGGRDGEGQLPEDFWPTYSAMANTDGGIVLLGVREKKGQFQLQGLKHPDRVHKQLVDLLQNPGKVSINLLTPKLIEQIEIEGKVLLRVTIPRASRVQRPVYLNGNPLKGNTYRRFHEADQHLDDDAVKLMLSEQQLDTLDDSENSRWSDRITLDGAWSGNLYDFYRKVYPKLIVDLKIPFELKDGLRQSDSPVHVALREALANTLVHADYRERARIFVLKRKEGFAFTNPGLMRVPPAIAVEGDEPDCRNRSLQAMFRYVNIGEQAGTGLRKIFSGWEGQHWRRPSLKEIREPSNRTILEMQMLGLFPDESIKNLRLWLELWLEYDYDKLSYIERLALAIAYTEGRLTRSRLMELSSQHPSDLTKTLGALVKKGLLAMSGSGKGALYRIEGTVSVSPDDVFGKAELNIKNKKSATNSPNLSPNSPNLGSKSPNLSPSSPNLEAKSPNLNSKRNEEGKLKSDYHDAPFIDDLDSLSLEIREQLERFATAPRQKKKLSKVEMKQVILSLCAGHYVTVANLARLVKREPETLRSGYLNPMCKSQELEMAFPETPNHVRQAYTRSPKA